MDKHSRVGYDLHAQLHIDFVSEEEEELRSSEEAGVNRVYVRKTSLATPKGNDVRCRTPSPFAGSRHYISDRE